MTATGNKIGVFEAAKVQVTAGGRLAERSMNIHRKRPRGGQTQLTNPINYQTITTDQDMAVCSRLTVAHIFCFMEKSYREEMRNKTTDCHVRSDAARVASLTRAR